MSAILEINDLTVRLQSSNKSIDVVKHINFSINRGETYCLVGESGSGKSITALSIMQLLSKDLASYPNGSIVFNSNTSLDLLSIDEETMRRVRGKKVAMVFQEPMSSLNPVYTVGDQIIESLLQHFPELSEEAARLKALHALEQVQIPDAQQRMNTYPHQLSGGQRQRVMIAMTMAMEPELLIADEPTTALDVTVQSGILELIADLQKKNNMSVLFITHDLAVVSHIADRVGVMQNGLLLEQGTVQEVIHAPKHEYTKKLIASLPEHLERTGFSLPDESEALFAINHVSVHFPVKKGLLRKTVDVVKAVDDVSLTVRKGEVLALVGESGSGKTTLGRALLRLQPITDGAVWFNGQDISQLNQPELRPLRPKMQMVFQDPASSLNPRLSIASVLLELMRVHGIGEQVDERISRAEQLLERVGLSKDSLWRYAHEFSGGQRQRLGIVRALILDPEFILCDEITSALDVSIQAEILYLLNELRVERELTLLFISHDIAVVEFLADRIAVMQNGRLVEMGRTESIIQSPQQEYTQRLLDAVPRIMAA